MSVPSVPLPVYQALLANYQNLQYNFRTLKDVYDHPKERLESWFSGLKRGEYDIVGNLTYEYNCIAWAAGVTNAHWWPYQPAESVVLNIPHTWPNSSPREKTVAAFEHAFQSIGYEPDPRDDNSYSIFYDKVALFLKDQEVCHASRMERNGKWTSKIGWWERIEHPFEALCGNGPNVGVHGPMLLPGRDDSRTAA